MILIADSGSTKCDWVGAHPDGHEVFRTQTAGLNPVYHSSEKVKSTIEHVPEFTAHWQVITTVYFYGAGCSYPEKNAVIHDALQWRFPQAKIHVAHDLLGAAYAAYPGEPNITCILGTGSNACFFDGKTIHQNTPSLGYILGDEGSGAYLGKKLVTAYLYHELPADIEKLFSGQYHIDTHQTINAVYNNAFPNKFLAAFAPFIHAHKNHPYLQRLVHESFTRFLTIHVRCYPQASVVPIQFIGSIAYYFQSELKAACSAMGLRFGNAIQKPIDTLIQYHTQQEQSA